MNTRGLLDQLLKSGQDMFQGQSNQQQSPQSGQLGNFLSGAGGGALAGTAVALLLGNKKARKMGGKALKYGGVAAIGFVAFKAYQNWQRSQASAPQQAPQTVDRLPAPQAEQHSEAILRAMLGAAKADGHIDDRERQLIDEQMAGLGADAELMAWIDEELRKPVDPADIARAATSPELAAEMYLASLMMADDQSFMEKAYLDELAQRMSLDPALRAELDAAGNPS